MSPTAPLMERKVIERQFVVSGIWWKGRDLAFNSTLAICWLLHYKVLHYYSNYLPNRD